MHNQRIISVDVKDNQFVKKIHVTLSRMPIAFSHFSKEIGMKPDLGKIFKQMNQDQAKFNSMVEKFETYLKKSYDYPAYSPEDLEHCKSWMIALAELFNSIGKEDLAKSIQEKLRTFDFEIYEDQMLKSHGRRSLNQKLFFEAQLKAAEEEEPQ